MKNLPKNQEEFNSLMESIDEILKSRNIPMPARPLHGAREVAKQLKMNLILTVKESDAIPGNYSGRSLSGHVYKWFNERYGERLKIFFGPGSAVIIIRKDPYKMNFPRIYGSVKLICDRSLKQYENIKLINSEHKKEPLYLNVLACIEDLPHGLSKVLTNAELRDILNFFLSSINSLHLLYEIKESPFITEARGDLESAISSIFLSPPQYGLSKWSSLQFTEKLLKGLLILFTEEIPFTHDLIKLSKIANKYGLPDIPKDLLRRIQCSADIRYNSKKVSLSDAISAHHASLNICSHVAKEIKKKMV